MNKKRKTVETCNRKEKKDNVVIDVDNDSCSDVVDVDDPKFLRGSSYSGVRKDEKYSPTSVIYIDDDKDYDETTQYDNLDKGRYDEQNSNSVNISNSKRTYPGKASARNRYGLGTDSESALSDDDDSEGFDSEFEGFSEKLKQEWEKAFSRRQNEYFSRADQAGTSSFCSDSHQNIETGDRTARYSDGSDFTSYTSHKERDRSPSIPTDNGYSESVSSDDGTDFLFEGFSGKLKEEWEKAFRRRQNEVFSSVDQDGNSRFCSNTHQDVGTGDKTERYSDDPNFTSYTSHKGVERSPSVPLDGGKSESTFCALALNGKFLLAARKSRHATFTEYIISLSADDMSKGSTTYIGKLKSNFLGTKFAVYDALPAPAGVKMMSRSTRLIGSKQVLPGVPSGSYPVAHISYELIVLGSRGPRRMQCIMDAISTSAVKPGGVASTQTEFQHSSIDSPSSQPISEPKSNCTNENFAGPLHSQDDGHLILTNKSPRWNEQLQCWCLNFNGRVTIASVKNFQLVTTAEDGETIAELGEVILQFGKVDKDVFTMDYRYPISAFQAFAICLSSFDTKIACE